MAESQYLPAAEVTVTVEPLTNEERKEVLAFLSERPLHTIGLAGFIRDNNLESPYNRGTFYGCRNSEGRLEGVALVGHATLIEARTDRAVREFALTAHTAINTHLIMGEQDRMEQFWNFYADEGQDMRLMCREFLFELKRAVETRDSISELRLATSADLESILPVHAQLAFNVSGVNPLETDPEGFRARCLRRIEAGRVWVLIIEGKLIFKADIQADTPDVIYLEGIYVSSQDRRKGIGRRCLSQLTSDLLTRTKSVCVFVDESNVRAQSFYRLCNFKLRSAYHTIFLHREPSLAN